MEPFSDLECAEKTCKDVCDYKPFDDEEEAAAGVQFFPPLSTQRYMLALKYLKGYNISSVIDFGCSKCDFFKLLPTVESLQKVALVDVDRDLLVSKQRVIRPEMWHVLLRRRKPLHVSLLAGSAEHTDKRLRVYEAVTMIEVIEHLYPQVLENVVQNVFGNLRPKLCVVTTPNSEFNVLFENEDPGQFRHWDHKFEWTRQEFRQWCSDICDNYCYTVEYTGVGVLASRPESDHLGPCSQAAVFVLSNYESPVDGLASGECIECFELIAESDFPYQKDVMSLEEKVDLEVSYCVRQWVKSHRQNVDFDEPVDVPVSAIVGSSCVKSLCDEVAVRKSLQRCSYKLSKDESHIIVFDDDDDIKQLDNLCDDINDYDAPYENNEDVSDELQQDKSNRLDAASDTDVKTGKQDKECRSSFVANVQNEEDWDAECS